MQPITLYYRPDCAFSLGVLSFLFLRGAELTLVNLDLHPAAARDLDRALGEEKLETPVIELKDGTRRVAPTMSELKKLLPSWGLPEAAAPYTRLEHPPEAPAE